MINPGAGPAVGSVAQALPSATAAEMEAVATYLRGLPLANFSDRGDVLRLELLSSLRSIISGGEIVQDHRTEQLYDQLIQLFLARTTEVLAVYINPIDVGADDVSTANLPPEVVSYLCGTGLHLLLAIKTLSASIHTFDSEPPLGNLLVHLVACMVNNSIDSGSDLDAVIAASLTVLRNLVRFRALAEMIAKAEPLKTTLNRAVAIPTCHPTYVSIVGVLAEAARCLGHYYQGAQASESRRVGMGADATALIDTLVESVARLHPTLATTRLELLCQIVNVLPEPGTCTVYLSRFQEVQGPELLVTVIRDVGQLNSPAGIQAITTSLDTLGVVISRTTVHAGHGNDGLRYWLRAPRSGRYEYQAMAVDVFLQVVEMTPSQQVAEHAVAILTGLFPLRPLYGTSHAMAIFSTFRQRFCELGHKFQTLAVEFTRQLGELIVQCDAHGAAEIARCFRSLCKEPVYLDSMRTPTVLRHLIDIFSKFTSFKLSALALEVNPERQMQVVDDLVATLKALSVASSEARDCIYYYGMATFLAALHCSAPIRELVAAFLLVLTSDISLPRRYIAGLTEIMLAVDATDSTLQQSSKDAGDARQREADVISAHVCQRYWGSGADEFEAPHVDGVSRSSMGEAPIWVVQHPTADTILCCLRLLCSAFASNQRARGLFVDTTGVTPLLRVLVHYGKMLTSDTPAGDANVQCFVGSLMCYAWLTARPHSFEVAVDPFHAACAESGVTTVSSAAAVVVTIALTCALGLVDVPRFLINRFKVDAVGCSASCAVVRMVLGDGLPTAADTNDRFGIEHPAWCLQHPAVLPTIVEMLTSGLLGGARHEPAQLLAETIDVIGELVASETNCVSACDAGLLETILVVFRDALVDTSNPLHDRAVWLTKTLGARKMSGKEVRQYFSLMNAQGSIAGLLKPLQHMLEFTESRPAHYAHLTTGKSSNGSDSHSSTAMQFSFDAGQWPPSTGFTVSFWFQYAPVNIGESDVSEENRMINDALTLCSLRGISDRDTTGFAVILDLRTRLLTVDLSMGVGKGGSASGTHHTRCEFTKQIFNPGQWYHVTITHEKKKSNRLFAKSESELRLYSNGICLQTEVTPSFGAAQPCRLQCVLGGAYGDVALQWDLGTLSVLRCCVTAAEAFVLHALGPNVKGFRYNYTHTILPSHLTSQIIQDLHRTSEARDVFDLVSLDTSISHLSKMLLCFFRPSDGDLFCENCGPDGMQSGEGEANGPLASRLTTPSTSMRAGTPSHRDSREGQDTIQSRAPAFVNQNNRGGSAVLLRVQSARSTSGVELRDRRGLREALFQLGGMHILLYRLATLCPMESEQVSFLRFFFSMLRGSPENARSLQANEGYNMLESFLSSDRCVVGRRLISVLLHAAFDDGCGATNLIALTGSAVVVNPSVLHHILLSPTLLRRCRREDAIDLYTSIASALDPSVNRCSEYNARQFRSVNTIEKLLIVFENETDKFPGRVVQSLVRIIHFVMIGAPRTQREVSRDIGDLMSYLVSSHKYRSFRSRQTQVYASLPSQPGSSHSLLKSSLSETAESEESGFVSEARADHAIETVSDQPPVDIAKSGVARKALFDGDASPVSPTLPEIKKGLPTDLLVNQPVEESFIPVAAYPATPKGGGSGLASKRSHRELFSKFLQTNSARITHPRKIQAPTVDWLSQQKSEGELPSWSVDSFDDWWTCAASNDSADVSVRAGLLRLLLDQVYNCQSDVASTVDVKSLLALCDHIAEPVRIMVIHLIDYLLRQCPVFSTQFLNANGFRILANQLQQHPVSPGMFVAVCNICTGQYQSSAKNMLPKLDLPSVVPQSGNVLYWVLPLDPKDRDREVDKGHSECIPVLFSLLIAAVDTPHVCINFFYTIHNLFILRPDFRNTLLANDVVQTICDVLAAAQSSRSPEFALVPEGHPITSTPADTAAISKEDQTEPNVELEPAYSTHDLDLLLQHAEAFLMDITSHVCRQISLSKADPAIANVIEDIMDYLSNWGLPPPAVQRLQRTVLQTALNQLFTSFDGGHQFWKLWNLHSKPKHESVHPAQGVCLLAIDSIVLFDWIGVDGREATAVPPTMPLPPAAVAEHEAFVCATFNTIKILIVHDTIITNENVGETSRLRDQFGRFLIYLLDSSRSRTVLEFVVGQLANNRKLYDILAGKTLLCRQLLSQMQLLFENIHMAGNLAEKSLLDGVIEGILHVVGARGIRHQLVNAEASCLERNADTFRLVLMPCRPPEQQTWSHYYDRNRIHEIDARGGQKRLRTQAAKELRLKVGISAVDVTSSVIELQDKHKKRTLLEMQSTLQTTAKIQKRWRKLLEEVCQPMAVWAATQTKSVWVLDPSEGPQRMRKRLVLTPMDRDMSTVSRSPMKSAEVPKSSRECVAQVGADGNPDSGADSGAGSVEPSEAESVMSPTSIPAEAHLAAWYTALCNVFNEHISGRGKFPKLQELAPHDQYTLCCRLVSDRMDDHCGLNSDLDLPTLDQVLTLWQRGVFCVSSEQKQKPTDPIEYLMGTKVGGVDDAGGGLLPDDHLTEVCECNLVTPFAINSGELLLGKEAFYFKEDPTKQMQGRSHIHSPSLVSLASISRDPGQLPCWRLTTVREVHDRRYLLQQTALEIFLVDGTTLFLNFSSRRVRDDIKSQILSRELPAYVDYSNTVNGSLSRDSITAQWSKGTMSNFEYLMHVNKLAGRSFNDLTQYPVMPFILRDYSSNELDLSDPNVYRDLRKPMGAQDDDRLQKFLKRYNDLIDLGEVPYHYGSHYSSVGSVLHLLVRLEPFTQLFLELQGGRLDFADRTFHDIGQTWDLSSRVSSSDVKELVPEMFFLPECLLNLNNCPFGLKQDGVAVDDVVLPPWANGSARRFVHLHRQALESEYVSKHLNHWIDLVFGAKQDGEAAHAAHNCFLPASYEGAIDIDAIEDPVEREAQWAIVRSFGQTPRKLLLRPHVTRQFKLPPMLHTEAGDAPMLSFVKTVASPVHAFFSHKDGVIGMGKDECILPKTSVYATWGNWDGALRFCAVDSERELASVRDLHNDDTVGVITSAERDLVVVGGRTGLVMVLQVNYRRKEFSFAPPRHLLGHVAAVTAMAVSDPFSVLVSGDQDGTIFVWDLNRFARVRALPKHETGVACIAVSNSTGDIVTVRHCYNNPDVESRILLWSINGTLAAVGDTRVRITAACVSSLRDGCADNVVATGMADGSVRFWASLDLAPIMCLADPSYQSPITAMQLSDDCASLLVGTQDSSVLCWLKVSSRQERRPRFGGMLSTLASNVRNRDGGVVL